MTNARARQRCLERDALAWETRSYPLKQFFSKFIVAILAVVMSFLDCTQFKLQRKLE